VTWSKNTSGGPLSKLRAFTISLQNTPIQWQCYEGETLLASARRQGVALPSSCQNGTCRTCRLQTHSSELEYVIPWPGLSPEEKAHGLTLSCVATPKSEVWIDDARLEATCYANAFQIIQEDPLFIILNKPSGLLSVPGKGPDKSDCLSTRVQKMHPHALVVHRLDQATSGLMMMAIGPSSQRQLSGLFEKGQVHKTYMAKVKGQLPVSDVWQEIDAPIHADWSLRPRRVVDERGKSSLTRYRCIKANATSSLLEIEPMSGRTHQIRVHLSHIGHPIWGDALYADPDTLSLSSRLLLHAKTLRFMHPLSHEEVSATIKLSEAFDLPENDGVHEVE